MSCVLERLSAPSISVEEEPQSIFELDDWDHLIILDACRYDIFKEVTGKEGYRISKGNKTKEYVKKNFAGEKFSDIVYITGNPWFSPDYFKDITGQERNETFAEVFDTYESDWNEEEGVVLPEPLCRDTLIAKKLFPNKKTITHFMQPHAPFLESSFSDVPNVLDSDSENEEVLTKTEKGEIEREKVVEGYKKNLEIVWKNVQELAQDLDGKVIVTADHGELLGEYGRYGHTGFVVKKSEGLRKVPWYVIDNEE